MTMAISPAMPPLPADIADDEDAAGSAALDGYADHLRRAAVHAERCVCRLDQALALLVFRIHARRRTGAVAA
jgi:hypothetical protein